MMDENTKRMLKSWLFWRPIICIIIFCLIIFSPLLLGADFSIYWACLLFILSTFSLFYQIGKISYNLYKDK